jgi:hypothetical protein
LCVRSNDAFTRRDVRHAIDDQLTILFPELAALGTGSKSSTVSEGRHSLTPSGVTTIGPIDKDWMRHHCIEQLVVRSGWIIQTQLVIGRALHADNIANGECPCVRSAIATSRGSADISDIR